MAFYSGFFNSKGLDRTYTAEDLISYLSSIICNGILDTYGQMFRLTAASTGLKVTLGTGKAWINGHYFINDSRYVIDLTSYQDESLPRYVGIAIYLDTTESVRSVMLNLPATVTTIGEKAFACESLTSVTLPETLTTLGTYLFMNSHTLTSARVECEEIPSFCFVGTPLQNLTLSYNVKKIGSHMINYTPLHELVYEGSLADWATVTKGGNWDNNRGQGDPHGLDKVICLDVYMEYDRENRVWTEVHK